MKICRKRFHDLSVDELYKIMKLRVDVFVVEQSCTYHELDGLDQEALHVWLEDDEKILAYLRVMDKGVESEFVSIGRVISANRGCGLGSYIMQEGILAAQEVFGADTIYLEAQTYARCFYEKQGFRQASEEFLLDDIPHIKMLREKDSNIKYTAGILPFQQAKNNITGEK